MKTTKIETQVNAIVPDAEFITKAIRSAIALEELEAYFHELEAHGQKLDTLVKNDTKTIGEFLYELVGTLQ